MMLRIRRGDYPLSQDSSLDADVILIAMIIISSHTVRQLWSVVLAVPDAAHRPHTWKKIDSLLKMVNFCLSIRRSQQKH